MHSYVFLFLNIGTPELMFILLAILLLFGGNKLPELARGLGKGIREFKDASDNVKREIHRNMNEVKQNIEESAQDLNPDTAPKQQDQSSLK
jgi:sec-independent protein translocase protein TatA